MNIGFHKARKSQGGFSLVELLIGMVIGLFLMLGVGKIFDGNKRSYAFQEGLSQTQEQGRFAMEFLAANLRIAGAPKNNPPLGFKIEGTDGATDAVTMRYVSAGDVDCQNNLVAGTIVNQFRINQPVANPNISDLECSADGGATWETYVPNIEDMQLMYGEDTTADGVPNRFMLAAENPAWADVVSIRVSLLVRSANNKSGVPIPYTDLAGTTVTPTDRRLRRRFVSTINLRN
jgi:type IV pilus assembly protein PilW